MSYTVERNDTIKRNLAIKLLIAPKGNHKTILDMGSHPAFHASLNKYPDWNELMVAWESIGEMRSDNPYPDDCEESEIIIDEMRMSGRGAIIKAFQMKDGNWVNKKDGHNWLGVTWLSFNVSGESGVSNCDNFKYAVWKTVTEFAMFWCEVNVEGFNEVTEIIDKI